MTQGNVKAGMPKDRRELLRGGYSVLMLEVAVTTETLHIGNCSCHMWAIVLKNDSLKKPLVRRY